MSSFTPFWGSMSKAQRANQKKLCAKTTLLCDVANFRLVSWNGRFG